MCSSIYICCRIALCKGSIITVLSQSSHQYHSSLPAGGISAHNTAVTSTAMALLLIPHKNTKLCTVWPLLLPRGRNSSWFVVGGGQGAEAIKQRGKNSDGDGTGGTGCRRSLKNGSVSTSEGLKPREWRVIWPLLPLSEITHTPQTPPRGPMSD